MRIANIFYVAMSVGLNSATNSPTLAVDDFTTPWYWGKNLRNFFVGNAFSDSLVRYGFYQSSGI